MLWSAKDAVFGMEYAICFQRFSSLSARGMYEFDQISREMLDTRRRQAMRFRGLRTNSSPRWSLLGSRRWQAMQSQWMPAPSL
ncbi:hypothetical protein AC1031_009932 [Aphanomyces cochlioides]|nr:hypothetical protein AC1031_009932 [Aphanomyces cochlioides]